MPPTGGSNAPMEATNDGARWDAAAGLPQRKVWLDGRIVDTRDARISVYAHGLLDADAVLAGIRVYHGKIFDCEAHLDRLWDAAKALRLSSPLPREQRKAAMEETGRANGFRDCYTRAVVTRGAGYLGLNPN